jgi:hypothetical protein
VNGEQWISFLRQYGPIPTKDSLYDENLRRLAKRTGISQILFKHPFEERVLPHFNAGGFDRSVILTGTAGDGKTFLCGRIWEHLKGSPTEWEGQQPYLSTTVSANNRTVTLHVLRDLSGWVPLHGTEWPDEKLGLMRRFCESLFTEHAKDLFLIAANDGQLTETLRRLPASEQVLLTRKAVEEMLVTDHESHDGCRVSLYNLSRGSSSELFDLALGAFVEHPGWKVCAAEARAANQLFGTECPIRRNYELLSDPVLRKRLRALLELCDQNGLHVPVRQILILLTNSVLGHQSLVKHDYLMRASDIAMIIANGTRPLASIYNNIFGGNLPEARRGRAMIFDYLERFQIGRETSNRIDNILIFGESHELLRERFERLVAADRFYGEDPSFAAARQMYVEGADEANTHADRFLTQLVAQRRALFFKIPEAEVDELKLWELTVFRYGGEYLEEVLQRVSSGGHVRRGILGRIVRGMNRIFTGMMLSSEHELYLASSASLSHTRVSRFLEERISTKQKHTGECIEIAYNGRSPELRVCLGGSHAASLRLTLTRYEYLSRVAEGAMPTSFSKECFEDLMAFKSLFMQELQRRNVGHERSGEVSFTILEVDASGTAKDKQIGVML